MINHRVLIKKNTKIKIWKKLFKLLFLIPTIITLILLTSFKQTEIEKIGKEVGSKINGENQILIEKLNDIINNQRKK